MKITGTITPVDHATLKGIVDHYRVDLEVTSPQPAAADGEAREALVEELLDRIRVHARVDDQALRYSQTDGTVAELRAALTRESPK